MVSSSSDRTFAIAAQLIPQSFNTSAFLLKPTDERPTRPLKPQSHIDQVLPQFYVQQAGPFIVGGNPDHAVWRGGLSDSREK